MFKLDFSLVTAEERAQFVNDIDLTQLTPNQIELCANYILYGKDENGKSEVDKKNIYINTKYNSYSRARPESLDLLMENPNFDEGLANRGNTHYKKVKPVIDRVKDANIPTMKELWECIDNLQHILDVNLGKVDDPAIKKLSDTEIYKLKHTLIDIRRSQYYLKDIFKPTKYMPINKFNYVPIEGEFDIIWNDAQSNYAFAPMGLIGKVGVAKEVFENVRNVGYCPDLYNRKAKYIVDFTNPKHVYEILEHYEDLVSASEYKMDNLWGDIARTIDYYIDKANLKEQHYIILDMKKKKKSNKAITEYLHEKFGLNHTENYISTIWTQKICGEIAAAAKNHYEEFLMRDDDSAWKCCNTCGEEKFLNGRFFVKKSRSKDGYSNRCKCCDRLDRLKRKES